VTDLTPAEEGHVRIALRYFRREYGGWKALAKMLRVQLDTVQKVNAGGRNVTGTMAVRVARIAGVPVEALLAGKYPPADLPKLRLPGDLAHPHGETRKATCCLKRARTSALLSGSSGERPEVGWP
jgi:hypothetical protein